MKTLVLGASPNPERFSFKAVKLLRHYGHEVIALGNKTGIIHDVEITTEMIEFSDIHTITIYLNPINQKPYYNYIIKIKPKRIIFNPGTENTELKKLATENGIECIENCTLIMLSSGIF